MTFIESLLSFAFLRPLWLLTMPLLIIVWFSHTHNKKNHAWKAFINNDFLTVLTQQNKHTKRSSTSLLIIIGIFISIIALAGPSIKTTQNSAFQTDTTTIIIADASLSMLATDISPSRKKWVQLKIQEFAKTQSDGLTALIMYSGDAHIISPFTRDNKNIIHLTQVIEPEILPLKGSNPEAAFKLASQLFNKNNIKKGNIIWITDGIEKSDITKIAKLLDSHQLSTLVIGTTTGAPIKFENGQYLKNGNDIIVPSVNTKTFDLLAKKINQPWQWLTRDDLDLQWISSQISKNINIDNEYLERTDLGFYLLILSALLLLAFLKPNTQTFSLMILVTILLPRESFANETWQSFDKQGIKALDNEQYAQAAELFENPKLKAYAYLKNNDFDKTIKILEDESLELNEDDYYNLGQAYAKKQNFEQALENFKTSKSLKDSKDVTDAINTTEQILQLQQENQTQTSTETSTDTSTDTQSSTDTQTSTDTSTSTDTKSSTQTSTETSTQSTTETSTQTTTQTSTDTQTDSNTDTNTQEDLNNEEKRDLDISEDLLLFYKNQFKRKFQENNGQQFSQEGPKW
ncbi:MAG: VWA domain-containing protein [Saccharospirillaceae bacterium]|nr:VWA domain-containing protein [Pseudomonadales bacterium]NRB78254.1 VWA domain-containing protein [Saccharospirillaceae bacterium]